MKESFNYCKRWWALALLLFLWSCSQNEKSPAGHQPSSEKASSATWYTCPMPEDSVFSKNPGHCPQCGMELTLMEKVYSCPMHAEVISGGPGVCPKCGMQLEIIIDKTKIDTLSVLLQPTNKLVVSKLKPIVPSLEKGNKRIAAEGYLTYDPKGTTSISARVAGRIEKLYVRYNFEEVQKGQKLLEMYSEELLLAQNEFLYANKRNDPTVKMLRERLLNLGMTQAAVEALAKSEKTMASVPVYATSNGHVHFLNGNVDIASHAFGWAGATNAMNSSPMSAEDGQVLKEGDYVKKGDLLFTIADEKTLWALFKVKPRDYANINLGEEVEVMVNEEVHVGSVDFIEKAYDDFYTLRVLLRCNDHTSLKIGSLVKGYISIPQKNKHSLWVPTSALVDLGRGKWAVFQKQAIGYRTKTVKIGTQTQDWTEVTHGISLKDSIAPIASYLIDSEAFIQTEE